MIKQYFNPCIFLVFFLFLSSSVFAQQRTITGKVSNAAKTPLQGVSVIVKNKNSGTETKQDGTFTIKAVDTDTLQFSHIGFADQQVVVGSKTEFDIVLADGVSDLSNVTVTVVNMGYGTLTKKEVSSAVTHISSKELLSVGGNGALMSLQGKVAGLTISNPQSADPNSTPSIQLRGVSSRSADLEPLYVINGIAGGNINNINQNDIESIDVLKGGAAASIYGTRGTNGVIIITTKKGTTEPRLLYDGYVGLDFETNKLKVLSAEDFVAHNRGYNYGGKTDWLKSVSNDPAFSQKHTIQFSGGNAKTNYMASVDYRKAEGVDLRGNKEEYGARLNINHTAANNLYTATVNVAPRYAKVNHAYFDGFRYALTLNPTYPVKDSSGHYTYINTGFDVFTPNAVEEALVVLNQEDQKSLDINGSFKLNILKNLSTTVTVGQVGTYYRQSEFTPASKTTVLPANNGNGRSTASQKQMDTDLKSFEWIGNYDLNKRMHSLKVLGGYSYVYNTYSEFKAHNEGIPSDALTYNSLGDGIWNVDNGIEAVSSNKTSSKLISFFGRLNYNYDQKYFLSASLRHEGSSKFGKDNKWGNFPAVSAAWRITQEQFMPKLPWLNELKLRADYGVTGNQGFDPYKSLNLYGGAGYYPYNGTYYRVFGPNQNANYNLRWEKTLNFNVGLDFDLLKSVLSGSLNYYINTNKDLLGDYYVPVAPNVQNTTVLNVGTMKNEGFEIQLNASVVRKHDFSYNISFAGATNNNKFVSFSSDVIKGQSYQYAVSLPNPGSPGTSQILQEGKRVGSFFMYKSAGVDSSGALLVYDKSGKIIRGNTASMDDKQYVGNGLPKFTASMGNNFSYKKWDLGIFLRGAFGYQVFNTYAFKLGTSATPQGANVLTSAFDGSKYSKLTSKDTYAVPSDYFLEPGGFVKIDNVSLGFTQKFSSRYIRSLRIYSVARNLHTFKKYTGGDIDIIPVNGLYPGVMNDNGSGTLNYYPATIQLLFGLQLQF